MSTIDQLISELTPAPSEARVFVIHRDDPFADTICDLAQSSDLEGVHDLHVQEDREMAQLSRGLLRLGAGILQGCDPAGAQIERDACGRPVLPAVSRSDADLNTSRRDGAAAIVLSRGGECGIDIESLIGHKAEEVIESLISHGVIEDQQCPLKSALTQWAGYEACLKADGRGLRDGLGCVLPGPVGPNECPTLWVCDGKTWQIQAIPVPVGLVGVVACAQGVRVVSVPCLGAGASIG